MSAAINLGPDSNICVFLSVKYLYFLLSTGYTCAMNLRHSKASNSCDLLTVMQSKELVQHNKFLSLYLPPHNRAKELELLCCFQAFSRRIYSQEAVSIQFKTLLDRRVVGEKQKKALAYLRIRFVVYLAEY